MAARLRRIKDYAEWMKYDISQRRFADVAGKRSYFVQGVFNKRGKAVKKIDGVQADYRGLNLCEPCWNGAHFIKSEFGKGMICNCKLGFCDCPCSQMQGHDAEVKRNQKARRIELAKSQTSINPELTGVIEVR